jgi:hypothetical protein
VWESKEAFDAFGTVLVPILQSVGVQHSEPTVMPIHNVIVPPVKAARLTVARPTKAATRKTGQKTAKRPKRRR